MRYKYFVLWGVILVVFLYLLFNVQNRIKKDTLFNFSIYQSSISRYFSFKLSQFLRARMLGLSIISSLDDVKRGNMEKIQEVIEDYFKDVEKQHVKGVFLYGGNGLVIFSTFERAIGLNHSNTDFFKLCKEGKRGKIFSKPILNMEYNKLFPSINIEPSDIFLITPVYADESIFSGALAIIVNLKDYVEEEILSSGLREFSDVLILSNDGTLLYSRLHPEMIKIKDRDDLKFHYPLDQFRKVMEKPSGDFEFYFGKEREIANFQTVQADELSLKIFMHTPYKEIVRLSQRGLTSTLILVSALFFLFSLSFFMFMRANIQKVRGDEKIERLRTRLELEERVRRAEEEFYTFANITSDGIWLYKTKVPIPVNLPVDEQIKMIFEHGYLDWCNDSMAKMYGLESKEQFIGTPLRETLNPEEPRNVEFLRAFIEGGYNLKNYESYEKDLYGKTRVFLNSLHGTIKDKHLIEAWGTQKDITGLKEMEEERRKLENHLFQARKMEALGRLTGGIAHDFNNILTAIIGNAELSISGMAPSDPNYRRIKSILDSANMASNLTKKLLTFSKKQFGETIPANLNDVIKSMEDLLKRTIGENINLILDLEKNLKNVEIETTLMEQIILNLFVNAKEAMPEGGKLTISTRNVFKFGERCFICSKSMSGEFVELSISDEGVGISPEIEDKIFDPFYSTKKDGTGLGLSTVYGAVSQLKGHLNFKSKVGEGTTFFVYLPVYREKEDEKRIAMERNGIKGGDETILIVEDEKEILDMMGNFLSELGYEVITASSAEEAMEKIEGISRIDFLVTDVILPRKKGPDFAKTIKVIYPHVKILFISGYPEDRLSAEEVLKGKVNFLPKPFTPFSLAKRIREILESRS